MDIDPKKKFLLDVHRLVTAYILDEITEDDFQEAWIEMGLKLVEAKNMYANKYNALGVDLKKVWENAS